MSVIVGVFTRRGAPVTPQVISTVQPDAAARIFNLGSILEHLVSHADCSAARLGRYRFRSAVVAYHDELYFQIVATPSTREIA